jgi:type IV pilus assembly protein PilQ
MDNYHTCKGTLGGIIGLLLLWSTVFSCGDPVRVKPDPSFDKWKVKAEDSRGYLPTKKKHAVEYSHKKDRQVGGKDERSIADRKLPDRRITLKLQDTDVGTILRALARAVDLNIILNERVSGKTTINVKNARWDQLFNGLLRSYGLTYTWEGELLRVMTLDDMESDLKRASQTQDLKLTQPLQTHIIPISYADEHKLKSNLETFLSTTKDGKAIGSIMVDEHTRSLIIKAIKDDMAQLVPMIDELDRPISQVLVEAFVVEAGREVARELGVQWGGVATKQGQVNHYVTAGANSSGVLGGDVNTAVNPTSGMAANFPAALAGGSGFTMGYVAEELGENLLTVQLSALQESGQLNILSSPSITTVDNQVAFIYAGTNVPYQTVSKEGNINIQWKEAVLKLEVRPNVIDKDTVKLSIKVNKDELDFTNSVNGNPTIITKKAETTVVLMDGQTTVIGGLNKETTQNTDSGVPWLEDIPLIGYLFKGNSRGNRMEDILIFITPRVLKEDRSGETASPETTGDDAGPLLESAPGAAAEPFTPEDGVVQTASPSPVILGQIAAAPGETLWDMIRIVYGVYRPSMVASVLAVNPHIDSPDRLRTGQMIYFPAIVTTPSVTGKAYWWVQIDRKKDLAEAFDYVRNFSKQYPPVRVLPHWSPQDGLWFSIILQEYFLGQDNANERVAALSGGQFDGVDIISAWGEETIFYADPYLSVQ